MKCCKYYFDSKAKQNYDQPSLQNELPYSPRKSRKFITETFSRKLYLFKPKNGDDA